MSRLHEVAFIFVACLAQFLSLCALNQTVGPVIILANQFEIHDYGTLSWFSAAYSMTVGTFILPAGRLGDMYGHKKIFLIGWIWFAAWSLASGFCYTSGVILFSTFRALQGIGPALLVPNAIALMGRTFPVGVKRNTAFACFGAAGPTGATAGAVFSAIFAQLVWWPWSFWVLAIVCVCVAVIAYFIIPDPDRVVASKTGNKPSFDYLGTVTGVTGLVLINFALNQAPLTGWSEPYIPTLLVLGFVSLAGFVWVELRWVEHPLIPIHGLQVDAYYALACIAAGWGSHGIWAYYLYLFLEHLKEHSALLTSAETSPVAVTGVLFAFSTVWLVKRIPVSWVMLIAMLIFFIGSVLLATLPLNQTYWAQTFISVLVMPGAMNLSFPSATILLSSALPKEQQGIAASLVSTMVNYCISAGLGFAGSLHRYCTERAIREAGIHITVAPLHASSPEITAARLRGMRGPWWFAVGLSLLGVATATAFILKTRAWKPVQRS
ncbi:major facilitator superfamily [Lineolata rhizophorae]|uniref:Major facilitator superfamily n=1 Tax=Lineolata rhizophorae TaxID=578093 RepID=A0A6A6P8B5_9PEZI|nr:major facilitator superfamily [Lineolata rhizophorae]